MPGPIDGGVQRGQVHQLGGAQDAQQAAPAGSAWSSFKAGLASVGRAIANFFSGIGHAISSALSSRTATAEPAMRPLNGSALKAVIEPMKDSILGDTNVRKLASADPEERASALGVLFRGSNDKGSIGAREFTKPLMAPMTQVATDKALEVLMEHVPHGASDCQDLDPNDPGAKAILAKAYNAFLDHSIGALGIDRGDPNAALPFPDSVSALLKEQIDTVLGTMVHASAEEKLQVRDKIIANAMLTGLCPQLALKGQEIGEASPNLGKALKALSVLAQAQFNDVPPTRGTLAALTSVFEANRGRVGEFRDSVSARGGALLSTIELMPMTTVSNGVVEADWDHAITRVEGARPAPTTASLEFPDYISDDTLFRAEDQKATRAFNDENTKFLRAMYEFSKAPSSEGARAILENFTGDDSPKQINLYPEQLNPLREALQWAVANPGSLRTMDDARVTALSNAVDRMVALHEGRIS